MRLFEMSDSQLDGAVQRHYDYLLSKQEADDDRYCCKYCWHYNKAEKTCSAAEERLSDEELEQMELDGDFTAIMREPDDYCDDDFDPVDDEPPYDEDDR